MPDASKGVAACCKGVLKNGFREHSDGCPLGEAVKALKAGNMINTTRLREGARMITQAIAGADSSRGKCATCGQRRFETVEAELHAELDSIVGKLFGIAERIDAGDPEGAKAGREDYLAELAEKSKAGKP